MKKHNVKKMMRNVEKKRKRVGMHVFMGSAEEMAQRGKQLLRMKMRHQTVVFFDIDDTLIHSRSYQPIQPIVDLLRTAHANRLHIVIITARPDHASNRLFTQKELAALGIPYHLLYLCPVSRRSGYDEFKRECRRNALHQLNAHPLFSIGDRDWDFGEHGGIGLWIQDE